MPQTDYLFLEENGFPSLKVFDNHFEIKALDYWKYKAFEFSEVKTIEFYDPNKKWWRKLYISLSLIAQIFSKDEPWILKITKKNGGVWTYKTSANFNSNFNQTVKLLRQKVSS